MLNIPRQTQISDEIMEECKATPGFLAKEPLTSTSSFLRVGIDEYRKRVIVEILAQRYNVEVDTEGVDAKAFHGAFHIHELACLLLNKIVSTKDSRAELASLLPEQRDYSQGEVA